MGCCCACAAGSKRDEVDMDDSDNMEDLDLLEKTLDEVMLRSPISPDKAWDYYRLSFGDDQQNSNGQTTHGPEMTVNTECPKSDENNFQKEEMTGLECSTPPSNERPDPSVSGFRKNTELTEPKLSRSLSSPITISGSANRQGVVNRNLAEEQLTAPSQLPRGVVSQKADLSCETNRDTVSTGNLLFTTQQTIKAVRPRSLATVSNGVVCLPLTDEKVKTVTAVQANLPIDIHGETFPYADEDDSESVRDLAGNGHKPSAHHNTGVENSASDCSDSDMYRYGYSDGGYRRYTGGSGSSSSYLSPTLSQRSSYSRPTMISSISPITNGTRARDSSYGASSLRRSTSLGNDRPYYTSRSSADYSSGSRLHYDYSSRSGPRSPVTYRRTLATESDVKTESSAKDNTDGKDYNKDLLKIGTDSTVVGKGCDYDIKHSDSNVVVEKPQERIMGYRSYLYSGSPANSSADEDVKSGTIADKQTAGYKKASSRCYINMNYERCDPASKTSQQRTGTQNVMSPSKEKKTSPESSESVNVRQDGPGDRTKVVSQVTINTSAQKQNRYTHNRQIWSRAADSTNISSENYSDSERKDGREISNVGQPKVKDSAPGDRKIQSIDLRVSGKEKREAGDKTESSGDSRHYKASSGYYSHSTSRGLTAKPWYTVMGANVQSTHSSASSNEDTDTNMEDTGRRQDSRDRYRNRHRSEEEDYVLTESTASFVFKDGKWVPEGGSSESSTPALRSETVTSTYNVPPLTTSGSRTNSSSESRFSESLSRGRDIPYRSTSLSSAGSVSPSKYESASSMPDSPGITESRYYSKGDNHTGNADKSRGRGDNNDTGSSPGQVNNDTGSSPGQVNNAGMNLYTERMNIISGFDQDMERSRERPPQNVVTEKLHISMSPPTFKVGSPTDNVQTKSDKESSETSTSIHNVGETSASGGQRNSGSTGEASNRSSGRYYSGMSYDRGTTEASGNNGSMATAAKSTVRSEYTPYFVTEPPEEEISRNDSENSKTSADVGALDSDFNTILFIDEDNSGEATADGFMGAQISSALTSDGSKVESNQSRAEQGLFQADPGTGVSRRGLAVQDTAELPAGVERTTGPSHSTSQPYSSGNVNRENNTTSSAGSSQVNKTGLSGSDGRPQQSGENQVSGDGTDAKHSGQDTSCVGEKSSLSTNERIDTVSTTHRPRPTTQLQGNSSGCESLAQDDGVLDRTGDTRGFSELGSMSNNQISERRGGIYYNENVSRRNVTGILASDHEDRRRALALSQTETQRSGQMVQTNDRSEVRQLHAGQTATRKAAGVEVSKDGDRSRSRDVTDTVDRSRTDTEYRTEAPSGEIQVSKVREDRQGHSHQDRQVQSEIKKDGREVRQSSSSKSESAQVSRVTESGDSRVSQRQERSFKSSRVTRSSRTSGSGFSRDDSLRKAVGFGSDDSDEDWGRSGRSRDSGDGSAVSRPTEVDRYTGRQSDSDNDDDQDDPYRETIVHENKAAEVLTNSVSRTDKEGTITLAEQRQRGLLDRGVTRNISEGGNVSTQRVQQRSQVQSARRTASSSYSRTSGSSGGGGDSGTVSAEDESVILAALLGRLEEKEVAPFTASEHLSRMATTMGSESGALVPIVHNTEDVEGEGNTLSPEEQSRAIARAKLEFQARQAKVRRPVARKRTIIVDEEMMEEMFLRCIICRDRYDTDEKTPKLLPCHHTFCLECLREMFRVESEHRQTLTTAYRDTAPSFVTIHCPTCRASHMITDRDFKSYKSDHKLLELLEISASPSRGSLGYCKTHRTQVTDHFCETCLHAVCSDCKVLDHREQDGHTVYSRAEALKLYANQAFATVCSVDVEDRKLAEMEKNLSGALDVINTKLSDSEQKIRQTFDKFKVSINNRQDQLLEKIETEMGSRREEFSNDLSEITKRMETIEKTQTTTKQAQEDEDVEQMFTAHQNAREMFKNTFEPMKDRKSNIKSSFHYDKRDRANIMNTVSDHGMITFMS